MKNSAFFFETLLAIVILVFLLSCKVKKQTTIDDKINAKSTTQLSAQKQQSANIIQQTQDSSKTVKKDNSFISIVEKDDVEYDYPNPAIGEPSKITRHIEKTTNFQNGKNITNQKNIRSTATAKLENSEQKNDTKVSKTTENKHSVFSMTSSSMSWIWIVGLVIVLVAVAVYLIKRVNLISLISSSISKIV